MDDFDIDDSSLDALYGSSALKVMVGLDEAWLSTGLGHEQAGEVDHLITFDGPPTALVLPVTDFNDNIHGANLRRQATDDGAPRGLVTDSTSGPPAVRIAG